MLRPSNSSRFYHPKNIGEKYISLSSSLCSFLHSLVNSSLLGTNILLKTLFSNIIILIISIKDWTSLIRSVSRVTTVLAKVSPVFQMSSFLVVCSGMISTRFGFVAFFASVTASSVCIHISCLLCL